MSCAVIKKIGINEADLQFLFSLKKANIET